MAEKLFREFPPISTEEWKEKVLKDLKGKSFEVLEGQLEGGASYGPFYRQEDIQGLEYLQSSRPSSVWSLHHDFRYASPQKVKELLAGENGEALQSAGLILAYELRNYGSELPLFGADHMNGGLHAFFSRDISSFPEIVNGRDLWIQSGHLALPVLLSLLQSDQLHPQQIGGLDGGFNESFLRSGLCPGGEARPWTSMIQGMLSLSKERLENFRPLSLNTSVFHNAGANPAQEIGVALAMLQWSFEHLAHKDLSPEDILSGSWFDVSIGPDFFGEIAKLRALRHLVYQLARAWGIEGDLEAKMHLAAQGSAYYQSGLDVHTNLLRSTTQGMAAVIGGCDRLSLPEFDLLVREPSPFSTRMSRNIQLILRDESFLGAVADPAGGSWYVEQLTHQWVLKGWEKFLQIEQEGGILAALRSGSLQKEIGEGLEKRQERIDRRKITVLGANQYPNPEDNAAHLLSSKVISFTEIREQGAKLPSLDSFSDLSSPKELEQVVDLLPEGAFLPDILEALGGLSPANFSGLDTHRASYPYEELRLQGLRYRELMNTPLPKVFLYSWGSPAWRTARQNFALNLLQIAGFPLSSNTDPADQEKSLQEMKAAGPFMVVLCSSDAEYLSDAPELIEAIREVQPGIFVCLAGKADAEGKLEAAGVQRFIHAGMDVRAFSEELLAPFTFQKK